jgi:heme exporter protein D
MTAIHLGAGVVVFGILYGVVHTVSERRQQRRVRQQREERERSLNREP